MKRRLFALMMAGLMVFGTTSMVFAEEETEEIETEAAEEGEEEGEALVFDWAQFEEEVKANEAWAGDFVELEDVSLKMYVPSTFEQVELTDEDKEDGYVAYFTLGDDFAVGVQYIDMDSMELADYATLLIDEVGIEEANMSYAAINGLVGLVYSFEEDGVETAVVSFATEKGYILEFAFGDVSEESAAAAAEVMMASIQEA